MAQQPQLAPVTMKGVKIIFRNFRGEPTKYTEEGERTFSVLLDPQVAEAMLADGWNVKYLNPRDEEEEEQPQAHLPVRARWDKGQPPTIYLITQNGTRKRLLDEDEVEQLDWAIIENIDMIVKPFQWGPNASGKTGIKAYLRSMYVAIEEDELAQQYADLEEHR